MRNAPLEMLSRVHKALAHPVRSRILAMLRGGELCVCQLNAVIGLAPSTMSAHLAELRDAGLLAERKAGKWVFYRLEPEEWVTPVLAACWGAVADDPRIAADAALMARITELTPQDICHPGFDADAFRAGCCPAPVSEKE